MTSRAPASGPTKTTTAAQTRVPASSAGTNSSSGAVIQRMPPPISSGPVSKSSRTARVTCSASSGRHISRASVDVGTSCRRKVSAVATPKLPPPPCSAQKSSGFSVSLASTSSPAAVTSSTDSRLSQASPNLRSSHPVPPPRVNPPTPVVETRPPVVARS